MAAISSPQRSVRYNAVSLYADYPGIRDGVFKDAVLVSHKLMGITSTTYDTTQNSSSTEISVPAKSWPRYSSASKTGTPLGRRLWIPWRNYRRSRHVLAIPL
jgi:hypothetical protein